MAKTIYIKEATKVDWGLTKNEGESDYPGDTNIKLGCLMRIADATELMAKNYLALQNDMAMYKRWYESEKKDNATLLKRNAALRGYINRLKKKK